MTNTETRLLILNESDVKTCLHGCGCQTRLPADFHTNAAWYAEIEDGEAVVLCPTCWAGQCLDPDADDDAPAECATCGTVHPAHTCREG